MSTRRSFLLAGCSACFGRSLALAQTTRPQTSPVPFLCKTEPSSLPDQLSVLTAADPSAKLELERRFKNISITEYGVSFLKDRWTPELGLTPKGKITLGVHFIGGTEPQRQQVRTAGAEWLRSGLGARLELDFGVPAESAQIRVGFDPSDGNWSYVGRNCLSAPARAKTMNIADNIFHVCLHEWGHAFGLQHEHQFPGGVEWNEQAVIADARNLWGWSEQQTRNNILNRLGSRAACVGDPSFNEKSIMLYPVKPNWTTNGFSSAEITAISERDIKCLSGLYGA